MITGFQEFILKHRLFKPGDKILLALSGGVDSVVLFHLLTATGYKVSIAHCNFGLRGKESDEDEAFVRNIAEKHSVPFFIENFNTAEYARARKLSIQMAARELRYEWLEQIRDDCDYRYIAIAHNMNDNIETLLMNITRGTGIKGLAGIPVKTGSLVRPLLFAKREEIAEFADRKEISYREDSSNSNDKYRRNFLRHRIIPLFNELNPSFIESAGQLIENMSLVKTMYLNEIEKIEKEVTRVLPFETRIDINALKNKSSAGFFLHEFLSVVGFSSGIIGQIQKSFDAEPGKVFYSPTHRLLKDRNHLILTSRDSGVEMKYYIDEDITELFQPLSVDFELIDRTSDFKIPRDNSIACLDFHQLHFPLVLRKWQKGDYFHPIGMEGLKKLSDYFIDQKLSLVEKENTWILASGNKIVWVAGFRIDDRFKITPKTSKIWIARIKENNL
jgi:tRNA(Ile)-lysidine synthase